MEVCIWGFVKKTVIKPAARNELVASFARALNAYFTGGGGSDGKDKGAPNTNRRRRTDDARWVWEEWDGGEFTLPKL